MLASNVLIVSDKVLACFFVDLLDIACHFVCHSLPYTCHSLPYCFPYLYRDRGSSCNCQGICVVIVRLQAWCQGSIPSSDPSTAVVSLGKKLYPHCPSHNQLSNWSDID